MPFEMRRHKSGTGRCANSVPFLTKCKPVTEVHNMASFDFSAAHARLIGLTGPAGCGKDTIAERLFAVHGFVPTAVADPLRSAASDLYGVDHEDFTDPVRLGTVNGYWGMTPRQMMSRLRLQVGSEFLVRRWALTYNEIRDVANCVVSDVEDDVAAEIIRDCGGVIIHVSRPGCDAEDRVAFCDGDLVLDNVGDIKTLYAKVDAMIEAHVTLLLNQNLATSN